MTMHVAPFTWTAPNIRYLDVGRDRTILGFQLPKPPAEHRLCCFWDADYDQRIIAVLISLQILDPDTLAQIIAVREQQGRVEVWRTATSFEPEVRRALQQAADRVLYSDRWRVGDIHPVLMQGALVNHDALDKSHPLQQPAKSFQLGTHAEQR